MNLSSRAGASPSPSPSPGPNAGPIDDSRLPAPANSNQGFFQRLFCNCLDLLKEMIQFGSINESDYWDVWSIGLRNHFSGQYSFSVSKANAIFEDQSQVEVGKHATFIGVYDGHGGYQVSTYVLDLLFRSFIDHIMETKVMSEDAITHAISTTETSVIAAVRDVFGTRPSMASRGSCCLIGVIWKKRLYIANMGDSRAVLGSTDPSNNIVAKQLTEVHNVSQPHIRDELFAAYPEEDSLITLSNKGVWRIKNFTQVSRAIGDACMKYPDLAIPSKDGRGYKYTPVTRAVLSTEPEIMSRELQENDQFLIFASDGLWSHFSIEEAVEFVHTNPRKGVAKGLVEEALKRAGTRAGISYEEMANIPVGKRRRKIHDDMTVVVVFIDHQLLNEDSGWNRADQSIIGFNDVIGNSPFRSLRRLEEWPPAA